MTPIEILLLILLIFVAFVIGRKVWIMQSGKKRLHKKSRNNHSAEFIDGRKAQENEMKKAYDIQDFNGEKLACIFAEDMLEAIKKFTDAFSNAQKTKFEAHYTFFGEDHALLKIVDLSDFQDAGYLVIPLTIFESNKIEYRSWRPEYKN